MSEVVAADRSRLLRSKRAESSGIVASRKRKLRELYAVCDAESPLPTINLNNHDAPIINVREESFLDGCDLLQDRFFDEAKLPPRRQLRSDTLKQQQDPSRPVTPESFSNDPARKGVKSQSKKLRATSPAVLGNGATTTACQDNKQDIGTDNGASMERSDSEGSRTRMQENSTNVINETIKEPTGDLDHQQHQPSIVEPKDQLESEGSTDGVESRLENSGVDLQKDVPNSAEEAGQLLKPLIEGQADHDELHKAAIAQLAPKEVEEQRPRDTKTQRTAREHQQDRLSIHPPARDGKTTEPVSSPGSTAHSATTPALHDTSTDTSPDNESSRYESEHLHSKDEVPESPPELQSAVGEVAERADDDKIPEKDVARTDPLRSSPAAIDAQIRQEEQAAAQAAVVPGADVVIDNTKSQGGKPSGSTKELSDTANEMDDETLEAAEPSIIKSIDHASKMQEVPDSEGEPTPVPMDVDVQNVKDLSRTDPSSKPTTDTGLEDVVESTGELKEVAPSAPATSSPRQVQSATVPERMTTRVASGAMRHKSVSEILGEIQRPNTTASLERTSNGKGATESGSATTSRLAPRSSTPQSPGSRVRSLVERAKDKERSKLSNVVFAKQIAKKPEHGALVANGRRNGFNDQEDYFLPMWRAKPETKSVQIKPVDALLASANKTITTSNAYVPILDIQTYKILNRIMTLQKQNEWSLRQPKRSAEPNRPKTHWDVVIQEAKWMRTDFREERKWKMTAARNLAAACAEWVEASDEDRKLLQINAIIPLNSIKRASKDVDMADVVFHPIPDLLPSSESDSAMDEFDDEPRLNLQDTVVPAAIFGLQDEDVVFGLRRTPATDKLLEELPMYGAPLDVSLDAVPSSDIDPDAAWKREALPLSKYVEGRMELKNDGPPRKRSRFDYEDDEEDDDDFIFGEPNEKQRPIPPESGDVGLFNPVNKHIRDRIHAGHQFRPPSEFVMPLQSFFEQRTASQWTWQEDDDLKRHVREYSYNWSLIASILATKSLFASGAERRTPWECFERWIHLEGLPADMQKTHYFRAYNTRLEMAQRTVLEQAAMAAPPQPNAAGQIAPAPRRRYTTSIRVERRRNQKHLTLVDAMRKLAKKRETSAQKQAHAAGLAALRKANEVPQPRAPVHTPQDFSKLKHEREVQMQERLQRFQAQQEHQRRVAAAQRQNPQPVNQTPAHPQQMNRAPNPQIGPNGQPMQNTNQLAVPGQSRPRAAMQPNPMAQAPIQNLQVPQMHMNGVPQAQMQGVPGRLPNPNPALDINLVTQSARIAEQQRQAVRMQQQGQQHPGQPSQPQNSPPNMRSAPNMSSNPPFMTNPNMMPPFNPNGNGVSTPPANGITVPTPGSAGSPRIAQPGAQPAIKSLEQQIRQKFPQANNDQVAVMIRDQLTRNLASQQMSQSAMNAAAGGNMHPNGHTRIPSGAENSPQLYAQMLRAQQAAQQANVAAANQAIQGNQSNQASQLNQTSQSNQVGQQHQASQGPPKTTSLNQSSQTPSQQHARATSSSSNGGK